MSDLIIRQAIAAGSKEGNLALSKFADQEGDEAAGEIVRNLTAAEVVATAITHDITRPSLVHAFTSPEQFPEVFMKFGQRWPILDDKSMEASFADRQGELESFLCPMILGRSEEEEIKMLQTLTEHELGCEALVFIGIGRPHTGAILENPNRAAAEKGTFEELFAMTAEFFPESWLEIQAHLGNITSLRKKVRFALEFCSGFHEKAPTEEQAPATPETNFLDI